MGEIMHLTITLQQHGIHEARIIAGTDGGKAG